MSKHIDELSEHSTSLFVYIRSYGFESTTGPWFTGPDGKEVRFGTFLDVLRRYRGERMCLFVDTDYSSGMCLAVKGLQEARYDRLSRKERGLSVHVVASSMGRVFPFVQLTTRSKGNVKTVNIPCGNFFLEIVKRVLGHFFHNMKLVRTTDEKIARVISKIHSRVLAQAPLVYRTGQRGITIAGIAQEDRPLKTGKQKGSQGRGTRKIPKKARK